MYNTSKGNYSVKLNKVIEKFNLKNLTPEVDTKKIVIRQTDVNRPALQFAGYFEYFDYSRIQLIGKVEYSYLKMHDDDYIREMTEKIFKAGIPCMILRTPFRMRRRGLPILFALWSLKTTARCMTGF